MRIISGKFRGLKLQPPVDFSIRPTSDRLKESLFSILESNKYNIKIVNFGHAGNGNIHVNLLFKTKEEKETDNSKKCLEEIFDLVLRLNGTLSGEHGIGIIKKQYIEKEINKDTLVLMKKIKEQFDPKNILNPNKSI